MLERACMITSAPNAKVTLFNSTTLMQEICSCEATLTGTDIAQCIFVQLLCNSTQITLTRT